MDKEPRSRKVKMEEGMEPNEDDSKFNVAYRQPKIEPEYLHIQLPELDIKYDPDLFEEAVQVEEVIIDGDEAEEGVLKAMELEEGTFERRRKQPEQNTKIQMDDEPCGYPKKSERIEEREPHEDESRQPSSEPDYSLHIELPEFDIKDDPDLCEEEVQVEEIVVDSEEDEEAMEQERKRKMQIEPSGPSKKSKRKIKDESEFNFARQPKSDSEDCLHIQLPELDIKDDQDMSEREDSEEAEEVAVLPNNVAEKTAAVAQNDTGFDEKDLGMLLLRMEKQLPEQDMMHYKTRASKLDWAQVAFGKYTPEVCSKAWLKIQRHQRNSRQLCEVIADAKIWLNTSWKKIAKCKVHPDYPKQPLSAFLLYFMEIRSALIEQYPRAKTLEISRMAGAAFRNLTEEDRATFLQRAASAKRLWQLEVQQFYDKHPDLQRKTSRDSCRKNKCTPFALYFDNTVENMSEAHDKHAFRETCKENYKNLPDNRKLFWINWALELEQQFHINKKNGNPKYVIPTKTKSVLNNEEITLKDKMLGKPNKPPKSAYALFLRETSKTDECKNLINSERMKFISRKWKELSEMDKKVYKIELTRLTDEYLEQLQTYLQSLPLNTRNEELEKIGSTMKRKLHELSIGSSKTAKSNSKTRTKPVAEVQSESDVELVSETEEPEASEQNNLLSAILPHRWTNMEAEDKRRYLNYIQEIKNHFDVKDPKAATEQ